MTVSPKEEKPGKNRICGSGSEKGRVKLPPLWWWRLVAGESKVCGYRSGRFAQGRNIARGAEIDGGTPGTAFPTGAEVDGGTPGTAFPAGAEVDGGTPGTAFPTGVEVDGGTPGTAFPTGAEVGGGTPGTAFPTGCGVGGIYRYSETADAHLCGKRPAPARNFAADESIWADCVL